MDTGVRTLGRFAGWGATHGPVWGVGAMLLVHLLPEPAGRTGHALVPDLLLAAAVGLLVGPVLAVLVGLVCQLAELLPHWLLDAPDYVAVAVVVGVAVGMQRDLAPAGGDVVLALLAVGAIAVPAALDAALVAPGLLPSRPGAAGGDARPGPLLPHLPD